MFIGSFSCPCGAASHATEDLVAPEDPFHDQDFSFRIGNAVVPGNLSVALCLAGKAQRISLVVAHQLHHFRSVQCRLREGQSQGREQDVHVDSVRRTSERRPADQGLAPHFPTHVLSIISFVFPVIMSLIQVERHAAFLRSFLRMLPSSTSSLDTSRCSIPCCMHVTVLTVVSLLQVDDRLFRRFRIGPAVRFTLALKRKKMHHRMDLQTANRSLLPNW